LKSFVWINRVQSHDLFHRKKSHLVFPINKKRKKKEGVFLLVLCNYSIPYVNFEERIFWNSSRSQFPNKTKINIMLRTIQITSLTSSVPFAPVISWRKRFKFKKLMDADATWWHYFGSYLVHEVCYPIYPAIHSIWLVNLQWLYIFCVI